VEDAHLSLELLAKLLSGGVEHDVMVRKVVPHFVARCPVCQERIREIRRLQEEVGHWDEEVAVLEGREAPELWERLAPLGFEEQVKLVEEDEDLHTWALCQLLLRKSQDAVFVDPAAAVNLANLAVRLSGYLGEIYDPNWVWDLRARAFANLGNARRVVGELRSADDAFRKAERSLARSTTGDPKARAEILDLKSSLRRGQRRFDEALALVDEAFSLYAVSGDPKGQSKCILAKSRILAERGDLESAISTLQQGLKTIDPGLDPRLFVYARYNLLGYLILGGRYSQAEQLLSEVESRFRTVGQPLDFVRLVWARAKIAFGLGHTEAAEGLFNETRRELAARGILLEDSAGGTRWKRK